MKIEITLEEYFLMRQALSNYYYHLKEARNEVELKNLDDLEVKLISFYLEQIAK